MPLRLHELSRRIGGRLDVAAADVEVEFLSSPAIATARDVTFIAPAGHGKSLSMAAAVLLERSAPRDHHMANPIEVDDLLGALVRASAWLEVRRFAVDPASDAQLVHRSAQVSPAAVIGAGARIGERTTVDAGAVIGSGVRIGAFCVVGAGVKIEGPAAIGNRCHLGAGSVIGSAGFALIERHGRWQAVPVFGGVRIGDDVVVRSQSSVHAGVFGDTVIGDRCALDSQVLIGHDARLGADCVVAGQTAVAGAAVIGRRCRIGGKVGIGEGVVVADDVTVTGMSMVTHSILQRGARYSSGWPAERSRNWWRRVARLRRLTGEGTDGSGRAPGC